MKQYVLVFSFISVFCSLSSPSLPQNPEWIWAKSARGVGSDYGRNVALDAAGNVYVAGTFSSPIITFNTISLTKISFGSDIFVVKYDNSGNILWAKNAGVPETNHNMSYCRVESMTTDMDGNCLVAGTFSGDSMIFDKTSLKNGTDYANNFFVVKYNTDGEVIWADFAKGATSASAISISSDSKGNSYLLGNFYNDSIYFDNFIIKGLQPVDGSHGGDFLVKYDPDGNALWAHCIGGMHRDQPYSISVDRDGNSYICGYMQGPSTSFGSVSLTNAAYLGGIFLVKYNTDGHAVWAKTALETGMGGAQCNSVCADDKGNVYLTGYFTSPAITFGFVTLTQSSVWYNADPFFIKYDADGNVLWAKNAGAPYITSDKTIGFDAYGNSYLTSNNIDDRVDLADKFDATGKSIWYARAYWGMSGTSICTDASGNSFVTGYFNAAQAFFGSTTLNNAVTSGSSSEFFIAKLSGLVTGISAPSSISGLICLYPSLAADKITIENNADMGNSLVFIFSANGRILINQSLPRANTELDISAFAKGLYWVRIVSGNEIILKKFVKI